MSPSGTRLGKKEKENSFCSHSVEGAAVPALRGSQAPAPLAGTSRLLQSLIPAFPTDKAVEQIAVTSSELNGGGSHVGSRLEKKKPSKIPCKPKEKKSLSLSQGPAGGLWVGMGPGCQSEEGHGQDGEQMGAEQRLWQGWWVPGQSLPAPAWLSSSQSFGSPGSSHAGLL